MEVNITRVEKERRNFCYSTTALNDFLIVFSLHLHGTWAEVLQWGTFLLLPSCLQLCISLPVLTGHQCFWLKQLNNLAAVSDASRRLCPASLVIECSGTELQSLPNKPQTASCSLRLMSFSQCQALFLKLRGLRKGQKNWPFLVGR